MISVGMMQVPIHQVVDMVAVRYCGVSAVGAVSVTRVVTGAMVLSTIARVRLSDLDRMLVVVVVVGAVKMSFM